MKYKSKSLLGIDKLGTEQQLIDRGAEHESSNISNFNSIKECHSSYLDQFGESKGLSQKEINSFIKEYHKHFKLLLNYDITKRDLSEINNSDFIRCSRVLHFIKFNEAKTILDKLSMKLNSGGIIVLHVNSEENKTMTDLQYVEKWGKRHFKSKEYNEEVWLIDEFGFVELIKIMEKNNIITKYIAKYRNIDGIGIQEFSFVGIKK